MAGALNKFMTFLIPPNATREIILKVLDKYQFCLVIDDNNKCIGTITDGDVRRALIKKDNQEFTAKNICQKNFKFANTLEEAKNLKEEIKYIPILDKNRCYKETYIKKTNEPNHKNLPIVIMAGGKGTRMKNYTKNMPKPLLKINGKTMLEIR